MVLSSEEGQRGGKHVSVFCVSFLFRVILCCVSASTYSGTERKCVWPYVAVLCVRVRVCEYAVCLAVCAKKDRCFRLEMTVLSNSLYLLGYLYPRIYLLMGQAI